MSLPSTVAIARNCAGFACAGGVIENENCCSSAAEEKLNGVDAGVIVQPSGAAIRRLPFALPDSDLSATASCRALELGNTIADSVRLTATAGATTMGRDFSPSI